MKEFLKYLKMIPVILYPYIYVFILAGFLTFMSSLPEDYNDAAMLGLLIVAVIYNLYSLVIVIVNAVQGARGKVTARQAARMNLIIKGIQIPAYIMHFILGFIGGNMQIALEDLIGLEGVVGGGTGADDRDGVLFVRESGDAQRQRHDQRQREGEKLSGDFHSCFFLP